MNKRLIVANWKMSPATFAESEQILDSVNDFLESLGEKEDFSLIICPPFIFLDKVGEILKTSHLEDRSFLGAQDIFWEDKGAFTGEISGGMLSKMDVRYVIVGHSERRWKIGETDEIVNKKIKAAIRNEIIPIVCLGELTRDGNSADFLRKQTNDSFASLTEDDIGKCIIAYEPVWAISTTPGAEFDTPESALKSIKIIKDTIIENWKTCPEHVEGLKIGNLPKVLYGGSVRSDNAADFMREDGIDGVLVGGASVRKEEFVRILSLAARG